MKLNNIDTAVDLLKEFKWVCQYRDILFNQYKALEAEGKPAFVVIAGIEFEANYELAVNLLKLEYDRACVEHSQMLAKVEAL